MRRLLRIRAVAALAAVERPDGGGAPTAFRIWCAGDNPTDHGVHKFTEISARTLMAEQTVRGNLYSIDADHLSLDKTAPPEARKAVGWHRLEVRDSKDGPELWATDVEWTEAVRSGLEKDPPEWRYFSPAYDVSKETGEIVAYLNTALTNNPATWSVTALATRATAKENDMKLSEILAALMGDDEEKKAAAMVAMKAAFPDDEEKKGDDDKKKPEADAEASAEDDETKKKVEETAAAADGVEKAAVAATARALVKIGDQDRRLAELEAVNAKIEREKILATRPDLTKAQVETLADEPLAKLPRLLALIPKPLVDPTASARATATRGATHGGTEEVRAARLPAAEHAELVERMGGDSKSLTVHWDRNDKVYPQITKVEARRILAKRLAQPARAPTAGLGKEMGR